MGSIQPYDGLIIEAFQRSRNTRATGREMGVSDTTVRRALKRNGVASAAAAGAARAAVEPAKQEPEVRGSVRVPVRLSFPPPGKGKVARYIFTCAQNNTKLHEPLWENVEALARHYGARIVVSRFTYDLTSYKAGQVKPGQDHDHEAEAGLWYDPRILPYIGDQSVQVAPGLVWCGEMNILPTAVRPLTGLESYTGRQSSIIPHAKFAMQSVAAHQREATKFLYTTGTITQRNYIKKRAGQVAEFHHGYGALLVEVNDEGNWWVRQLNGDSEGTIYDLTLQAKGGIVTEGHRVEGITWGDVHVAEIDPAVYQAAWYPDGMLDVLKPKYQFMHDILDFRARNMHVIKKGLFLERFRAWTKGQDSVAEEVRRVFDFLCRARRDWCQTIVVNSNHDNFIEEWLAGTDWRTDPANAIFFLRAAAAALETIWENPDKKPNLLEWAIGYVQPKGAGKLHPVRFLGEDDSFIICLDANGGIECGMHGHLGPNGARGSLRSFAKAGRKSNTGHSHEAGIIDGAYSAGLSGKFNQGYNRGPSSWSQSHIVTYLNGKRAIVTMFGPKRKWRA